MKKTERFNMKVDEQFLEDLEMICAKKPGIRTKTAAVHYCVDIVMEGIKAELEAAKKSGNEK
jgi:hypothetical protein